MPVMDSKLIMNPHYSTYSPKEEAAENLVYSYGNRFSPRDFIYVHGSENSIDIY